MKSTYFLILVALILVDQIRNSSSIEESQPPIVLIDQTEGKLSRAKRAPILKLPLLVAGAAGAALIGKKALLLGGAALGTKAIVGAGVLGAGLYKAKYYGGGYGGGYGYAYHGPPAYVESYGWGWN